LRRLRKASQQKRYRNGALPRLPSREAIAAIVGGLIAAHAISSHAGAIAAARGDEAPVFAAHKHRIVLFIRTVGASRARAKIGLPNSAYNVMRFLWLMRRSMAPFTPA
jgi:hypothetical protein